MITGSGPSEPDLAEVTHALLIIDELQWCGVETIALLGFRSLLRT
jgi:hypothetical protein